MDRTLPTLLTLVSALALATAAEAQGKGPPAAPAAAPPALPSAAVTARESSQGAAHAADIARDQANPRSAIAPPAPTTATGTEASATTSEEAQARRQGPANASPTAAANANEHAGLSATTASDLSNLKTGLTVKDSAGATIGTVSKITRSKAGVVENVLVASADGKRTLRLSPGSLSLSGDVVITSSVSTNR
jgi:hypothetical protein